MIRVAAGTVLAAALFFTGLYQVANSRTYQIWGTIVPRVETTKPVVALTFDDGPVNQAWLIPVLRELEIHATFYVIGQGLAQDIGTARALVAAGHELGNHAYSHQRMILKTPGWVASEVENTDRLIRVAGYQGPITFRPPYGKKLLSAAWYLAKTNRITVMWDQEPDSDTRHPVAPEAQVQSVLAGVRPGSIILLHGEQPSCKQVVVPLVKALKQKGYGFVTVQELLALR
jgi:peptidoglycan/xylan/chitin deacetylase (PgdA/CDA1 family)